MDSPAGFLSPDTADWLLIVATSAQVLALLTLVGGLIRVVSLRRVIRAVMLISSETKTVVIPDVGHFHCLTFTNIGRGTMHLRSLSFVGARPYLTAGYEAPEVLGSGEAFDLLITSPDMSNAYFVACFAADDDFRMTEVRWEPLRRKTPLGDAWEKQSDIEYRLRAWYRIRDRFSPRPVHPDAFTRTRFRYRANSKQFQKAMAGGKSPSTHYPAYPVAEPSGTLPYLSQAFSNAPT